MATAYLQGRKCRDRLLLDCYDSIPSGIVGMNPRNVWMNVFIIQSIQWKSLNYPEFLPNNCAVMVFIKELLPLLLAVPDLMKMAVGHIDFLQCFYICQVLQVPTCKKSRFFFFFPPHFVFSSSFPLSGRVVFAGCGNQRMEGGKFVTSNVISNIYVHLCSFFLCFFVVFWAMQWKYRLQVRAKRVGF